MNDGKINKGSNISLYDFVIIVLNWVKVLTSVPAFDFTLIARLKDDGSVLYIILQSTELHLDIVGDVYFLSLEQHDGGSVTLL